MGCIYIATNKVNGKSYIGKTIKTIKVRQSWHQGVASRGEGWSFHNALRKYGLSAFDWSIVFETNDPDLLSVMEQEFIRRYKTKRPHGYNLTDGGDGIIGRTPESLAQVADFHRGRKRSDETRKRISLACMGKQRRLGAVLSDATKKKISLSRTGIGHSVESRKKIGIAFKGKPKTELQKAKMSEARRLWWMKRKQGQPNLFAAVMTEAVV